MTDPRKEDFDYVRAEAMYLAGSLLEVNGSAHTLETVMAEFNNRIASDFLRIKIFAAASTIITLEVIPHLANGRQGRERLANLASALHADALSSMVR